MKARSLARCALPALALLLVGGSLAAQPSTGTTPPYDAFVANPLATKTNFRWYAPIDVVQPVGGWVAPPAGSQWGAAVEIVSDLAATPRSLGPDGIPEVAIGAPAGAASITVPGRVHVLDGLSGPGRTWNPNRPTVYTITDPNFNPLSPGSTKRLFGTHLELIGDLDGDGVRELAVAIRGSNAASGSFPAHPAGFAIFDGASGARHMINTVQSLYEVTYTQDDQVRWLEWIPNTPFIAVGTAWMGASKQAGDIRFHDCVNDGRRIATIPPTGFGATSSFGSSFAWLGDNNNNGEPEFAVGDPEFNLGQGAVFIYEPGIFGLNQGLITRIDGVSGDRGFGTVVAALSDVTGDGRMDLAVSVPTSPQGGLARVFNGFLYTPVTGSFASSTYIFGDRVSFIREVNPGQLGVSGTDVLPVTSGAGNSPTDRYVRIIDVTPGAMQSCWETLNRINCSGGPPCGTWPCVIDEFEAPGSGAVNWGCQFVAGDLNCNQWNDLVIGDDQANVTVPKGGGFVPVSGLAAAVPTTVWSPGDARGHKDLVVAVGRGESTSQAPFFRFGPGGDAVSLDGPSTWADLRIYSAGPGGMPYNGRYTNAPFVMVADLLATPCAPPLVPLVGSFPNVYIGASGWFAIPLVPIGFGLPPYAMDLRIAAAQPVLAPMAAIAQIVVLDPTAQNGYAASDAIRVCFR